MEETVKDMVSNIDVMLKFRVIIIVRLLPSTGDADGEMGGRGRLVTSYKQGIFTLHG